ncbi:hypothetical protein PG984_000561 [Apiospora sp. TS-2023a]
MAGHNSFQPYDPGRCEHYAKFASKLDRTRFEGLYWLMFALVIFFLFFASWIYQWTMWYKEKPDFDMDVFRGKLKRALWATIFIFLISAATVVIETFCLLALQFCDGEDLMSLYWSTWTMMQVGSQIAIGGIVLALWHTICNVKHPIWALAMGTPDVQKAKAKHHARSTRGTSIKEPSEKSSNTPKEEENIGGATLNGDADADADANGRRSLITISNEERFFFEIDVGTGNSEVIRQWPSFVSMSEGRALIQAVLMRPGSDPFLDSRPNSRLWSPQSPTTPRGLV